jgi:hypothetical protein
MKKNLFLIISFLFLTGCLTTHSPNNKVRLLWKSGMAIENIATPKDFVVTPQEVHALMPMSKTIQKIFVDSNDYYISPPLLFGGGASKTTSSVKQNSTKISGINRNDLNRHKDFLKK